MMKARGMENSQAQSSAPNHDAPKKNHFYVVQSRGDQESSPDVVIDMLQLFSFDVYALLDRVDIFLFVTPLVAMKLEILPDILDEPFLVSTLVGDSLVTEKFCEGCPISFTNKATLVYFVELDMLDFDFILGMNYLHAFFLPLLIVGQG